MKIFVQTTKSGPFLDPFLVQKFGHFHTKIRFSDIFFETAHQICQKTGDNCFESSNGSVVSGKKSCFGRFGHFWVKNTLLVVTFYGFGLFLAIFFQTLDDFSRIFVIYTKFYCLKMVNENFCSDKKSGPFLDPFLVQKFGHFHTKIRFWDILFETAHQIYLKLCQKQGQLLWII